MRTMCSTCCRQLAPIAAAITFLATPRTGEFPKFTLCRESAGRRFHVLVKFSGNDGAPGAERLADLLVCEHLALRAVAQHCYVSKQTRDDIAVLWHLGRLIANSDMHEGNLAFLPSAQDEPLTLAPVYDMLPMLYAPLRGVEIPQRRFEPALPLPQEREAWRRAAVCATAFWDQAAEDERISPDFRAVCAANGAEVRRLAGLMG